MTFHFPHVLWALFVPAIFWILEFRRGRSAAAQELAHPKIMRAQAGTRNLELVAAPERSGKLDTKHGRKIRWRFWLALACAVVAFARPQWGRVDEPVFDQAREIIIALDLSRSMLTPDIKPSRLDRGKLLVTSLLERLQGERVGLIVFAGTAFLQSPLSSDYEILNEFLPALSPDFLPEGGTNYKALIDTALSAFGTNSSADRFLIILSDGEATENNWKDAAAELKERGVRVLSLGVGTAEGAIVPDGAGGYVKDERGAVVLSKLEPATLQQLAEITHGTYRDASAWVDLAQLIQSTVDTGKKGSFREERQVRLVERFQWALAPAFLLFLWSFWREFPVHPKARDVKLAPAARPAAKAATTATVAMLAVFLTAGLSRVDAITATPPIPGSTTSSSSAPGANSSASSPAAPGSSSAAEPLSALVGQLAARPSLNARDYAELAKSTLTYAERIKAAKEPVAEGSILDALQAVDAGEALDSKAADWPTLREKLKDELKKPEPPPQQQNQKQNDKDKKNQDKDKDQQKDSNSDEQKSDQQKSDENQQDPSKSKSQDQKQNKSSDQQQQEQNQQPQNQDQSNKSNNQDSDQQKQNRDASKAQSAFGDMQKKPDQQKPQPQPASGNPETQKVGGAPDKPVPQTPANPELVVPLQKLEQVRNQDSPVRLQQIMRGDKQTPAKAGKNW